MKYNEELFNISKQYTNRVEPVLSSKKTDELEQEVLKVLLDRYKKILKVKDKKHDGVLKVRLRGVDDGYLEVQELIKLNKFNSFASDYCIYIAKSHDGVYIDLIWDYKTYFDTLNSLNQEESEYEEKDNIELMNAVIEFKKLPISHQLNVIKSFTRKVKKEKLLLEKQQIEDICKKEGHSFTNWNKDIVTTMVRNPYMGSRDYIVPEGKEWLPKSFPRWQRKCTRCGFVEMTEEEPLEVKNQREEEERQTRIKQLEDELQQLRRK